MESLTPLGRFDVLPPSENVCYRPDRRALAGVVPVGEQLQVVRLSTDGIEKDAPYSVVLPSTMRYAPGGRFAYLARQEKSGPFVVVWDGVPESQGYDDVADEFHVSTDGTGYAVIAKRGEAMGIATRQNFWELSREPSTSITINHNGTQVAWIVSKQLFINGKMVREAKEFLGKPLWSSDGTRLAYMATQSNGIYVYVGEEAFGPYDAVSLEPLVWSPNSQHCAWFVQRQGKNFLVLDGTEHKVDAAAIQPGTLSLSPDGQHWALSARAGFLRLKGCVVIDGVAGPIQTALGTHPPVWNSGSDTVAYFSAGLNKKRIICGTREGEPYKGFVDGSLTWNPQGTIVGGVALGDTGPCIALEDSRGYSGSRAPSEGQLMKSDKVCFSAERTIHDLVMRPDGTVCLWQADC